MSKRKKSEKIQFFSDFFPFFLTHLKYKNYFNKF